MDHQKRVSVLASCLRGGVLALAVFAVPLGQAATVWTGPNITWSKSAATPTDVIIPGKVELTRGSNRWLYNVASGAGESSPGNSSPKDTMWAMGDISNFSTLSYKTFASFRNGNLSGVIVGKPMVVHLVNEDIYFSIKFTVWGRGSGTVAYTRSTPAAAIPPTVSIASPTEGAVFAAPASIQLTANASVSGGTVTNVEYFAGATSLGSATVAPFTVTGSIPTPGSYALTAVATAGGISATSAVVNITVNTVSSPTVTITAPADGAVFSAPATVELSANASVSGGTVTKVEYFAGATSLGSATAAPFAVTGSIPNPGSYALTAVATAGGVSATSAVVNITVSAVSTPTVTITAPADGAIFSAPAIVELSANASVSGGTVTNVEYFAGTTSLGSATAAPFAVTGSIPAASSYALTAVATAGGVSATSAVVNITVNAVSTPTVTITAPTDGAIFSAPADVIISADATAGGGTVTDVSFFNQTTLLGSVQITPFSLTASNLAAGTYSLSAVATASGVSATSAVVNITVVSPVAFSLTSPTVSNGLFSFSYAADPGLTYIVQRASSVTSSNVFDWASLVTNIASTNLVLFSEALGTNLSRFYRVGRLPNP